MIAAIENRGNHTDHHHHPLYFQAQRPIAKQGNTVTIKNKQTNKQTNKLEIRSSLNDLQHPQ
jgi:hypothetical protein